MIAENLFSPPLRGRTNEVASGFVNQARGMLNLLLGFRTYPEFESG